MRIFLTILAIFGCCQTAAAQWIQNPSNGHWYRASSPGTWQSAEDEAVSLAGHLVTIDDMSEQTWLSGQFSAPEQFWIGLVQNLDDSACSPSCEPGGGWVWVDGTPLSYQNWAGGEPNNNHPCSEEVAALNIWSAGLWADYPAVPSVPIRGIMELEVLPSEWILNPLNDHWYRASSPGTWQSAEDEALANGGHLVTIDSQGEQDWLNTQFSTPEQYWIGLFQDFDDPDYSEPAGGWKWISGAPVSYTNWAPNSGGEPNDNYPGGERWAAMHIWAEGLWADYPDGAGLRGIIELESLPSEWLFNDATNTWYKLSEPGTWQSARDEALSYHGDLVQIDNTDEQQFLNDQCPGPENFWIGLVQDLNDPSCLPNCEPDGGWRWSTGAVLDYTNWASGEPNNNHPDSEERGIMNAFSTGLWADFPEVASIPVRGIIELSTVLESDCNSNGVEDECESDVDTDGLIDACDNCPNDANLDQADFDGDGAGDACDDDIDDDTVPNVDDACDYTPMQAIVSGRVILDPASSFYGTIRGDYNDDCRCDLADYAGFQLDFTGPNP